MDNQLHATCRYVKARRARRSFMLSATIIVTVFAAMLTEASKAGDTPQTMYFKVGMINGDGSDESYILPLSDPEHIAHALELVDKGPEAGETIVIASIRPCSDGINRNLDDPDEPLWSWAVDDMITFADASIEICDGNPSLVEADPEGWIDNTDGIICFWSFSVVDVIDPDQVHPEPGIPGDLTDRGIVNVADLLVLLDAWGPCTDPAFCHCPADLDDDGSVNSGDLLIMLANWG